MRQFLTWYSGVGKVFQIGGVDREQDLENKY